MRFSLAPEISSKYTQLHDLLATFTLSFLRLDGQES